jgi:alanine racemase
LTAVAPIDPGEAGGVLTIDTAAIAENWRRLAARAPRAECAAAVKADAYGTGVDLAVPALVRAGCRTFFVAHPFEASRVRELAPAATIYVLNGLPAALKAYAALDLRPVLGSRDDITRWQAFCSASGWSGPAAVHVDTGLNRLGVDWRADPDLSGLRVSLLMSHLACAEDADHPLNGVQIDRFRAIIKRFPGVPASLANSSGLFLPDDIGFAMVRPGYALYGGNPVPGHPNPMRDVVRLTARIVQVRPVTAGETVGYGATWRADAASMIAILGLGYADGFFRSAATHGAAVIIARQACPVVGRVSMDLTAVDVTALPPGSVRPGDEAEVIGPSRAIDAVAKAAGTIGYEVLTALGRRFHRRAA